MNIKMFTYDCLQVLNLTLDGATICQTLFLKLVRQTWKISTYSSTHMACVINEVGSLIHKKECIYIYIYIYSTIKQS